MQKKRNGGVSHWGVSTKESKKKESPGFKSQTRRGKETMDPPPKKKEKCFCSQRKKRKEETRVAQQKRRSNCMKEKRGRRTVKSPCDYRKRRSETIPPKARPKIPASAQEREPANPYFPALIVLKGKERKDPARFDIGGKTDHSK